MLLWARKSMYMKIFITKKYIAIEDTVKLEFDKEETEDFKVDL